MALTKVTSGVLADANVTTAKILDANITTSKLADDSVTAAKIASNAVVTDGILNANVTLAKLASDSVNSSKIVDASIAAGDLVAGLGGRVLIQAQTASDSANIEFTSGIGSDYDRYEIDLIGIKPATDDVQLRLLVSTGSFLTSAYDYTYWRQGSGQGSAQQSAEQAANVAFIGLSAGATTNHGVGNAAGDSGYNGRVTFHEPDGTAVPKIMQFEGVYGSADINASMTDGAGSNRATAAVTGLRVYFESGNISSGTLRLYGVR